MAARREDVNRILKREGLPVTLFRGNGYFYLNYDDGETFQTYSVYVCYFYELTVDQWLTEARDFATRMTHKPIQDIAS